MQPARDDPGAYLEAFMNGYEFALLALRGRLQEAALDEETNARIEEIVNEYARISRAYRERRDGGEQKPQPFKAMLSAVPVN